MKRMKRFVFCVEVEVWVLVLVWDENDDVSFCMGQRCSFVVGDGEKLDRFFFFLYFFLVAENMIISIFDITYGKFASLMLCYDDDGFF